MNIMQISGTILVIFILNLKKVRQPNKCNNCEVLNQNIHKGITLHAWHYLALLVSRL